MPTLADTAPARTDTDTDTDTDTAITVASVDLLDILANTRLAAGRNDGPLGLSMVRLYVADGRLHAAATDRYRIHRDSTPIGDDHSLAAPFLLGRGDTGRILRLIRPLLRQFTGSTVTFTRPQPAADDIAAHPLTVTLPDGAVLTGALAAPARRPSPGQYPADVDDPFSISPAA
ncbi:hypothetical protein [Frankia sp. Cas4]|uniref:hypothetical protein n=1 Tax=Frankia sp. Cas4 TaxID=3073927 RepID=UPI002AD392EC|nr:hypothetical protein [Frankia sp. Cas4]